MVGTIERSHLHFCSGGSSSTSRSSSGGGSSSGSSSGSSGEYIEGVPILGQPTSSEVISSAENVVAGGDGFSLLVPQNGISGAAAAVDTLLIQAQLADVAGKL